PSGRQFPTVRAGPRGDRFRVPTERPVLQEGLERGLGTVGILLAGVLGRLHVLLGEVGGFGVTVGVRQVLDLALPAVRALLVVPFVLLVLLAFGLPVVPVVGVVLQVLRILRVGV